MRILFISAWFPFPPDNGSRIRVYNLIKALSRDHEVYLVSLLQEDSYPANVGQAEGICRVVSLHHGRRFRPNTLKAVVGFFSSRPRSVVDTYDPAVGEAVRSAIQSLRPDALVASTLGVVEYVPKGLAIPSVLEQHNCEYAVLKRSAERIPGAIRRKRYELGWRKFARWEASVCRRFGLVTVVSDQDRELLRAAAPGLPRVEVVPNGVDTEYYTVEDRSPERGLLLYNGALTYGANLDAVRHFVSDIAPILSRRHPVAKLLVTGRTDGADLAGIAGCGAVMLSGYVEDMREVLRKASVCVVPLREGGGSRLKILEAMAAGVPVVSTPVGAEGIDAEHGRELLIAHSPSEFADCIGTLLDDPGFADSIASGARRFVEQRYSWRQIGGRFAGLVESLVGKESS